MIVSNHTRKDYLRRKRQKIDTFFFKVQSWNYNEDGKRIKNKWNKGKYFRFTEINVVYLLNKPITIKLHIFFGANQYLLVEFSYRYNTQKVYVVLKNKKW